MELCFTTNNAEETAGALAQLSGLDSNVAGELEDHGGIMGVAQGLTGTGLVWWVALARLGDLTGEGLLKLDWDPGLQPDQTVMTLVFELLDYAGVKATLVPCHKLEDYPSWLSETA